MNDFDITSVSAEKPVMIAGPTASGKSALALAIADRTGGTIVNADALQVFDGWRILTARPSAEDEAAHPHALYGHVPFDAPYSAGAWLRDVAAVISKVQSTGRQPIIVGGTGLYFTALTAGLAEIPATPPEIRAHADTLPLASLIAALDDVTQSRIDLQNRARVQRAFEVQIATGRGIAAWQDDTPPALLPEGAAQCFVMRPDVDWLNARIEKRFDVMLSEGALDEARAMEPVYDPSHLSAKAIGAAELVAHIRGEMDLPTAREAAIVQSRQYAKRQRTWFRSRMGNWQPVVP